MEPRTISPNVSPTASPEQLKGPGSIENNLNTIQATPEAPISSPEQAKAAEQLAVDHYGGAPLSTTPLQPIQQPQSAASASATTGVAQSSTPATASDGDLIDQEWLDKVKQVISSTVDDPHAQQKEVSKLMAEYVLKRTGRKIGEDK